MSFVRPMLIVAFWTIPILLSTTQHLAIQSPGEHAVPWFEPMLRTAPGWYLWALYSLLILRVARRFPPTGAEWRRAIAVHVPLAAALALIHIAVLVQANRMNSALARDWSWTEQYLSFLTGIFHVDLVIYAAVLGVGYTAENLRNAQAREAAAADLRRQLAEAQLQALRMQLNPHFLFNSLNAAVTLVRTGETATATRMLTALGDLLRTTLERSTPNDVPLRDEIAHIQQYLDVERIRFGDRLDVKFDVDPLVLDARVPSMLLQPLVENAVKHGIRRASDGGRITIAAHPSGTDLLLEVRDAGGSNGKTREPPSIGEPGVGISNTRARLAAQYGSAAEFRLTQSNGSTVASIRLPSRGAA